MKKSINALLQSVRTLSNKFDESSQATLASQLLQLSSSNLRNADSLAGFHEILLFICAYPGSKAIRRLAEKELSRIAMLLKKPSGITGRLPLNEGLPYQDTITRFTPDFLSWLMQHDDLVVTFDSFYKPVIDLNRFLALTLPSVLSGETTAGLDNGALLDSLGIKDKQIPFFMLQQLQALKDKPLERDLLFELLDMYVCLKPLNRRFSRAYNRIPVIGTYYHEGLLKNFDMMELLDARLPEPSMTGSDDKKACLKVIRNSMALGARETDPVTFMDERSFRFYELERGISIAIYGMVPGRQLPLESYLGFSLFKNGFPCAYGGAWVFGNRARFGMNIYEPFRGGESGYLMCQLLRVYRQVFSITCFEVEPYQYGLDNPDGIRSGAFWFYYRYGFRPADTALRKLAETEKLKINKRNNYRSSEKTLLKFTASNLELMLAGKKAVQVTDIIEKMKTMLTSKNSSNMTETADKAVWHFMNQVDMAEPRLAEEKQVLAELALWAKAMNITGREKLQVLSSCLQAKTNDVYLYQQLVRQLSGCNSLDAGQKQ